MYTLEEIYDMYNISGLNLKEYGYKRTLITVDTNNYYLYIVCFNKPFDLNNVYVKEGNSYYLFDETVRYIRYSYSSGAMYNNGETDNLELRIGNADFYVRHRIIYSSHNVYTPNGILFSGEAISRHMRNWFQ